MQVTTETKYLLELTEAEATELYQRIGKCSNSERKEISLATDASDPLSDLYDVLESQF